MATNTDKEFYREVDQYRHKSGCSGVIMLLIGLLALAGAAFLLLRYFGII